MARDPAGKPLKTAFQEGLRIFRLLGRRCAAGGAQRARRRRRAAQRSEPARRWLERAAKAALWTIKIENLQTGRDRRDQGTAAGQCRRAMGRPCAVRRRRPERRAQCPPGEGQPHRRRQDCSTIRPRLFLPERRRAHHLRHSLRGRLHADRHHRPGLPRRSARRARSARPRSTISAPRRASISRSRSSARTSSGPIPASVRSTMTAPPRRRRRRATTC